METNEPIGGLAVTYRVECYRDCDWHDMGVTHRSPYGALMSLRYFDAEYPGIYRIADELSPLGRRVTPTKFSVEDHKLGPTWRVPTTAPMVVTILPNGWPCCGCC